MKAIIKKIVDKNQNLAYEIKDKSKIKYYKFDKKDYYANKCIKLVKNRL